MDVALSMAQDLAEKSSYFLRYSMQLVNEAISTDLDTMIDRELTFQAACMESDEFKKNAAQLMKKS